MKRWFKQREFAFQPNAVATSLCEVSSGPQGRGYKRDVDLESTARELLRQLGANKLARGIRVEWNPRIKTCAGRADFRKKLISLNPLLRDHGPVHTDNLFAVPKFECNKQSGLTSVRPISGTANELECNVHSSSAKHSGSALQGSDRPESVCGEVDRTLRHELAHLLAQWRVGRRRIAPHGIEWHEACRDLGIADEARCHNLPFASKTCAPRYVYRCPNCKEEFLRVRRIRRTIACLACCRKHNDGDFDPRFRLKFSRTY